MKALRDLTRAKADLADLVGLAVFAGLSLLFIFGVVMPLALRDRQATAQIEAAARQRQRANAVATQIREAKDELDRAQTRLLASPIQIKPTAAMNERLAVLIGLAGENGLKLGDLKPGEAVRAKRFDLVPVRLVGRGGFVQVTTFLRQMHERMPDVAVCGFKLTGSPETDNAIGGCELELRWIAQPTGSGAVITTATATVKE